MFSYIEDSLEDSRLQTPARNAFRAAVLDSMGRLVDADAPAAAALVLAHFANDHAAVVSSLEPTPELQYEYLKARVELQCGGRRSAMLILTAFYGVVFPIICCPEKAPMSAFTIEPIRSSV